MTQAAIPLLDKAVATGGGGARVVNIASVAGVLPLQLQAAYSAAKSGVISLTQSMALELGKQGILCNAIAPGTIATAGTAGLWGEFKIENGIVKYDTEAAGDAGAESFAGKTDSQRHMDMIALGRPGEHLIQPLLRDIALHGIRNSAAPENRYT